MDFTPPFGQWLKQQRQRLDLTQADLARRLGYSPVTIRKIESGDIRPSKQMLALLADHLGVPDAQRDAFFAFGTHARVDRPGPATSNLPTPPNPLVGRKADVAAVCELLQTRSRTPLRSPTPTTPAPRLVTLVGPPGVGKTRLALEVAHEIRDAFPDGAWWVELAPVTDPQTALTTIAQALEIEDRPGKPILKVLQDYLRYRHMLLVLDNLEQVIDVALLMVQVMNAAPKVTVLTTSRELLRVSGEQVYAIEPLTDEAVALFMQRARAVKPSFDLTGSNRETVAAICRKLDGLPLAIELAAARVTLFTPVEMLARLDQRLSLLTGGARDVPPRQRTLRATLEWSFHLLSSDEQALFRRLGVFAGGFTMHAAQTFCEIDGLALSGEAGVAAMLDKNLLLREEPPEPGSQHWFEMTGGWGVNLRAAQEPASRSRYRMLESIREFALVVLQELGELEDWQHRRAEYLVAIRAQGNLRMPLERDNWRASMTWAQATSDAGGLGLLLARSSASAFHWREAAGWLERAIQHPGARDYPAALADALRDLGNLLNFLGDTERALATHRASLEICQRHDLRFQMVWTHYCLGHAAREAGDFATACAHLEAGNRWAIELNDPFGVDLITLAEAYVAMEDVDTAERLLNQALGVAERAADIEYRAWGLNHLAHVALLRSDPKWARALLTQSMSDAERVADSRTIWIAAWNYQSLGEVSIAQDHAAAAGNHMLEGLRRFDRLGDQMGMAWCLTGLAGAAALDEDSERGAVLWGAGEALRGRIKRRIAPASRLNRERTVALLRERLGEAEFARLAAEGAKLSLDEAVRFALDVGPTQSVGRDGV